MFRGGAVRNLQRRAVDSWCRGQSASQLFRGRRWASTKSLLPQDSGTEKSPIPPVRIILVRHGQSMGNVSEETYAKTPDWKIELTEKGIEQAQEAGKELAKLLEPSSPKGNEPPAKPSVVTYCSPYRRTLQTWEEIQSQLNEEEQVIGMRQEPRLAEQQFGNFQNPTKVLASKEERNLFGRFFYRFPNGESGMDVYSRVTSFMGSLNRDIGPMQNRMGLDTEHVNILCVTHGLTLRLFVMRYFQLPVEQFEETFNPPNGRLIFMDRQQCPAKPGTFTTVSRKNPKKY